MARTLYDNARVDRDVLVREPMSEQGRDAGYWWKETPRKRLEALELLRQLNYDYDPDIARLSRLHQPVKRAAR